MTNEFLAIKIDAGLLMKKLEEWKMKNSKQLSTVDVDPDIMLSASLNDKKLEGDSQPVYAGRGIAVWHHKKE